MMSRKRSYYVLEQEVSDQAFFDNGKVKGNKYIVTFENVFRGYTNLPEESIFGTNALKQIRDEAIGKGLLQPGQDTIEWMREYMQGHERGDNFSLELPKTIEIIRNLSESKRISLANALLGRSVSGRGLCGPEIELAHNKTSLYDKVNILENYGYTIAERRMLCRWHICNGFEEDADECKTKLQETIRGTEIESWFHEFASRAGVYKWTDIDAGLLSRDLIEFILTSEVRHIDKANKLKEIVTSTPPLISYEMMQKLMIGYKIDTTFDKIYDYLIQPRAKEEDSNIIIHKLFTMLYGEGSSFTLHDLQQLQYLAQGKEKKEYIIKSTPNRVIRYHSSILSKKDLNVYYQFMRDFNIHVQQTDPVLAGKIKFYDGKHDIVAERQDGSRPEQVVELDYIEGSDYPSGTEQIKGAQDAINELNKAFSKFLDISERECILFGGPNLKYQADGTIIITDIDNIHDILFDSKKLGMEWDTGTRLEGEEVVTYSLDKFFDKFEIRKKGNPKAELADHVEALKLPGIKVPKRYTFAVMKEKILKGEKIIIRSDTPYEYAGASGLLESYLSDKDIIQKLDRSKINNPKDLTDHLIVLQKKKIEYYCGIANINLEIFKSKVSYTYRQFIEGTNRTVVADDSVPGRYHVFSDGSTYNYSTVEMDTLGNLIIHNQSTTPLDPNLQKGIEELISCYDSIRNAPGLDPKQCPAIEIQTDPKGYNYFLQYHRTRKAKEKAKFYADKSSYPRKEGWIKAAFVRGSTPKEGIDVNIAISLGGTRRNLRQLNGTYTSAHILGVAKELVTKNNGFVNIEYVDKSSIQSVMNNTANNHNAKSGIFNPELSLYITEELISQFTLKTLVSQSHNAREGITISVKVVSDGTNAFIKVNNPESLPTMQKSPQLSKADYVLANGIILTKDSFTAGATPDQAIIGAIMSIPDTSGGDRMLVVKRLLEANGFNFNENTPSQNTEIMDAIRTAHLMKTILGKDSIFIPVGKGGKSKINKEQLQLLMTWGVYESKIDGEETPIPSGSSGYTGELLDAEYITYTSDTILSMINDLDSGSTQENSGQTKRVFARRGGNVTQRVKKPGGSVEVDLEAGVLLGGSGNTELPIANITAISNDKQFVFIREIISGYMRVDTYSKPKDSVDITKRQIAIKTLNIRNSIIEITNPYQKTQLLTGLCKKLQYITTTLDGDTVELSMIVKKRSQIGPVFENGFDKLNNRILTPDEKIQIIYEITQKIKIITGSIDDVYLLQQIARNMGFYGQTALIGFTRKNCAGLFVGHKNGGVDFTSQINHDYLNAGEGSRHDDRNIAGGESLANTHLPEIAQKVGMDHTMDPKTCQYLALYHRKYGKRRLTESPKYQTITENISEIEDIRERAVMAIYLLQGYPGMDKVKPETNVNITIAVHGKDWDCNSIEGAINAIHLVTNNEQGASDERFVNEYKLKKLMQLFNLINSKLSKEQKVEMSTVLLMWKVCGFRDLLKLKTAANDLVLQSTESAMSQLKELFKLMPIGHQKLKKVASIPIKAACSAGNYFGARQLITLVNQAYGNIDQADQAQLENLFSDNDSQYLELLDVFSASSIVLSSLLDKQKIQNIMNTMIYVKSNTKFLFKFTAIKKVLDEKNLDFIKELLISFKWGIAAKEYQSQLLILTEHICNIASSIESRQLLKEFRDLLDIYENILLDDGNKPNITPVISKIDGVIKTMSQSKELSLLLQKNNSKIIDQTGDNKHRVYTCKIKMNRVSPRINDVNRSGEECANVTKKNINEIYTQLINDVLLKQGDVLRIVVYDYTIKGKDGNNIQYSELGYTYDGKKIGFHIEHNLDGYKDDKGEKVLSKSNLIKGLIGYHAFMNECARYNYQFSYNGTGIVRINNQNYPIGTISFNSIHVQQIIEESGVGNSVFSYRDAVLYPFLNTLANVGKWREFGIEPSIIFGGNINNNLVFNEIAEGILASMREKLGLEKGEDYVQEKVKNNILVNPDFIRHNIAIKSVYIVDGKANFEFILTDVHGNGESVFK